MKLHIFGKTGIVAILMLLVSVALMACQKLEQQEERFPNGQIKTQGVVKQNSEGSYVKDGTWVQWHPNGQKVSEGEYRDGKQHGKWTEWYENGQKWIEGKFRNGEKHSTWVQWHPNGQKDSEGEYRDGKQYGKWIYWHENGQKRGEGTYLDGNNHGEWIYWHENGQKWTEGPFQNGEKYGKWVEWYENGQKRGEGTYLDGNNHGEWIYWHDNGQQSAEGSYVSGKRHGLWTEWLITGEKKYEVIFDKGKEVDRWFFIAESKKIKRFVEIPAGTFTMGSPPNQPGAYRETQHHVTLTRSFLMMTTEVTQEEWKSRMDDNPSHFISCGFNCPVENVNWHEALAFANVASAAEGLPQCFTCTGSGTDVNCDLSSQYGKPQDCLGYRLPTEAEWEYAARAGTTTAFYNGDITFPYPIHVDSNLDQVGWFEGNSSNKTHAVGGKAANAWGLYDMHGNVWEWTWDWYQSNLGGAPVTDPPGPTWGLYSNRVSRGGSWNRSAGFFRAASRYFFNPGLRFNYVGFRLVRSL